MKTTNETQGFELPKFNFKKIAIATMAIFGVVMAYVLGVNVYAALPKNDKPKYSSKTEVYESAYSQMKIRHAKETCEAEKAIAQANWEDAANGIVVQKDMNVIQMKKNRDCEAGFPQPLQ